MARNPRRVAILAYDQLCTFEFGIMVELFALPRPEQADWYETQVCALERGPLGACGGFSLEPKVGLGALDHAGTIILPGWREPYAEVPTALLRKLRRAHAQGARLLSVCSGAFVLAATGLLEGMRVATHWKYADRLRAAYPNLEVDADVLYVDEGTILTSAGSAAGIDLGLHLIRRDHGAKVANQVARRLVVPPHREGGQAQFIAHAMPEPTHDPSLGPWLQRWRKQIHKPHTVVSMARQVHLSERHFARQFKAIAGTTPYRWVIRERVLLAQAQLESSDVPVETIAHRVGFSDAQTLRNHFRRQVGCSPSAYRQRFRLRDADPRKTQRRR